MYFPQDDNFKNLDDSTMIQEKALTNQEKLQKTQKAHCHEGKQHEKTNAQRHTAQTNTENTSNHGKRPKTPKRKEKRPKKHKNTEKRTGNRNAQTQNKPEKHTATTIEPHENTNHQAHGKHRKTQKTKAHRENAKKNTRKNTRKTQNTGKRKRRKTKTNTKAPTHEKCNIFKQKTYSNEKTNTDTEIRRLRRNRAAIPENQATTEACAIRPRSSS